MDTAERGSRSVEKATSSTSTGRQEPSHGEVDEAQPVREPAVPEWEIGRQELYIILSLTLINMVVALDSSIIITALKTMTVALGADTTQGFWIGTSFLLASTVAMPPVASCSEIFGRPVCLTFSLAMFALGSVLCCAAGGVRLLLAGRALQGVGGGGIWMVSLLLLTDVVPLRQRPRWWAVVSLGWAAGLVAGPLVGGAIVQRTTWRCLFYLNFPFCAFGLLVTPRLLAALKPRRAAESMRAKRARIDWVGGALFMASLTLSLFALSSAGIQFAWSSVEIITTLVIGFAGLVATGVWEAFFAKEPMLKHSLFYSWSSNIAYFGGFVQGLVMYGENYYVPFFFQSVKATTPLRAGVNLLPALLFVIPSGAVTGALVSRFNNYRYAIWLGWFFVTLSSGLELLWHADVSSGVWVVALIIMGIGHGIVLNAQTFACQALAQPGDMAAAAAMYGFVRQLGSAVGVCISSSTWQNVAALKLSWQGLPVDIAYHAEAYVEELHRLPEGDPLRKAVTEAYVFGFWGVWQVFLGISGVIFFLSFFIKHVDMSKAIESEHRLERSGGGGNGK